MVVELRKIPVRGDRYVFQLVLGGDGEHRLNPDSIAELNKALDEVENDASASALLTTNEGKFFSNGLDLDYLKHNPDKHTLLIVLFHKLLQRILCFPIPTVAAVCGHATAGGCMMALAHDYRYMRSDRGFIFLNEVEIKLPLTPGMNAIIKSKLPVQTYHEAVLSAHRYVGKSAAVAGIINKALPDVVSTREAAFERASELATKNYDRSVYKALKDEMFKSEVQELLHGRLEGVPERLGRLASL